MPIANFMYKVKAQGDLGQVVILEGESDTTIQGQTVAGNNLIIYQPNADVSSGIDEFELTYCVLDGSNGCAYEKSIKVEVEIVNTGSPNTTACLNECIWPGDTNRDGVVNMEDLLPIGVEMGAVGVPRSQNGLSQWLGQAGNDWNGEEGINLKHIDTNGDSIVTAMDTAAISAFYGNMHGIKSAIPLFYKYSIGLDGDVFITPGDLVELNLVLGYEDQPIADLWLYLSF